MMWMMDLQAEAESAIITVEVQRRKRATKRRLIGGPAIYIKVFVVFVIFWHMKCLFLRPNHPLIPVLHPLTEID